MARTPSLSTVQCEEILGARGSIRVDSNNRSTVRKWLTAQGFNALFVMGLSMIELSNAYNQTDGKGLEALQKKLNAGLADADIDAADAANDGLANEKLQAQVDAIKAARADIAPAPVAPAPVAPAPAPAPGSQDAATLLRNLLLAGYEPPAAALDADAVRAIVQDALTGIAPRVIEVREDGKEPIRVEGLVHPEFERAFRYLKDGANVMLVGPAGCGKTYLAKQLSKALDVKLSVLCGSAGASESEVKGWLLPVNGGNFEYCPSDFVQSYEGGDSLICLDEIDAFDPNMLLSVNVPLANGHMYIPQRRANPVVARGANVHFVATANTFGTGANPVYAGRNPMDEATRDRFLFITVDYDKRLEEQIAVAGGLTAAEMAGIWELRDRCREAQLRRVISTRAFQKAATMKRCGDSWREIRDRLLEGWSKDEKAKVGA